MAEPRRGSANPTSTALPTALPTGRAYSAWAATYGDETAVSALEDRTVRGLTAPTRGRALLDVGCGTGRRLGAVARGAARVVGVDLVPDMLRAGTWHAGGATRCAADARRLPFADRQFDVLWCRLMIGHVADVDAVYRELARVARPDAALVVSDFHPSAVAAGHARTFRDGSGAVHQVEHHVHRLADHARAARAAGWTLQETVEATAGEAERPVFERAGRPELFEQVRDTPLVLALSYRR